MTEAMLAHLQGASLTMAVCLKITPLIGSVLKVTSFDQSLTVDGETYEPESGLTPSSVKLEVGTTVGGGQVQLFHRDSGVTPLKLLQGRYKGARAEAFLVNWNAPDDGKRWLVRGPIGECTLDGPVMRMEILPAMKLAQSKVLALTSAPCRVKEFGDAECGVSLTALTFTGALTTVTSRRILRVSSFIGRSERFLGGRARMTTGAAAEESRMIKAFDSATGQVELQEAFRATPVLGDTLEIRAGCTRVLADCKHYNNVVNFRGEPYLPSQDTVLRIGG